MKACATTAANQAGAAFDSIAEQYDELFTRSLIGRAQRGVVWDALRQTFHCGDRLLELNCGTGEDALFLARMGVSVVACDASESMIAVATRRMAREVPAAQIRFKVHATEDIAEMKGAGIFDGVLSNFSGLNCVRDLGDVARQLGTFVRPGGQMLLCLSTRICLWETLWYLAHAEPKRAFRRWKGYSVAGLGNSSFRVQYPTMREIGRVFCPFFQLRFCRGIGVTAPPSYVEHVVRRHATLLRRLQAIDRVISTWPICREIGDHMLLALERTNES